jgi:hypothetical protein
MSENAQTSTTIEDAKKECLEVVKSCTSKKEIEENHPEVVKAITENKWHYMYSPKYVGSNLDLGDTKQGKAKDIQSAKPNSTGEANSPLKLAAKNIKAEMTKVTQKTEIPKKAIDKLYKLRKYQPLSFTLNVGRANNLLGLDPKTGQLRAIRHCPNTKSIWLDEQNNDIAVVEPITFTRGFFEANSRMVYTQLFLDIHPGDGKKFEEVDKEKDASVEIDFEDIKIDIKMAIRERMKREGGVETIRAIVSVLNSDVVGAAKMTPSELRYQAYVCVDSNPKRFLNDKNEVSIFDDPAIKRTALAQHAFMAGVIQVSPNGRQVIWADTKKPIISIPIGLSYMNTFSKFLASDEGINVAQELTQR